MTRPEFTMSPIPKLPAIKGLNKFVLKLASIGLSHIRDRYCWLGTADSTGGGMYYFFLVMRNAAAIHCPEEAAACS